MYLYRLFIYNIYSCDNGYYHIFVVYLSNKFWRGNRFTVAEGGKLGVQGNEVVGFSCLNKQQKVLGFGKVRVH